MTSLTSYKTVGSLQVAENLLNLINTEIMPGTGIEPEFFWPAFEEMLTTLTPKNKALLSVRDDMQAKVDQWHRDNTGTIDRAAYTKFLTDIGYLLPEPKQAQITTDSVDPEIATIAGPQLVVPITNARFSLNAANARWGSLYDALYGTDVISTDGGAEKGSSYNPVRGAKVIAFARHFLDEHAPLSSGSHTDAVRYAIDNEQLVIETSQGTQSLKDPQQFTGYLGDSDAPSGILLRHNNLHFEIQIDAESPIGKTDPAHISDVLMESAITSIQDCEDSVAAVDAEDKALVYRNWLGLMKGDLVESFSKGGRTVERKLAADRVYISPTGDSVTLPGRSLLLVRNVGHLMTNPSILDKDGNEMPEGLMDAMITTLCALHDLKGNSPFKNSRTGNIYIVKPKMHGPDEVQFACDTFTAVEKALGLAHNTIKMGIMDEERRTTVNLKKCIDVAKERVIFINTGFLDRTGDEIHTSMMAGAFVRKTRMKEQAWIGSYEDWNVDIGLECGLRGKAQIGKGMWAKPDEMGDMLINKIGHPKSGANCAWVPSPTAATLHAIHYHQVNVLDVQDELSNRQRASLDNILTIALLGDTPLSADEIQNELDNNIQGILGYVVRWIDQGVGCSKVPDINNVGLMEDRATLRISSQHIANWLEHGICTREQVQESLERMSLIVDKQNENDPLYTKLLVDGADNIAFNASSDLIFKGKEQPSGYTEPLLHAYRRKLKVS
ncbi:MAG: malate synthase G [Pseudomonadota bacterium]